MERKYIVIEGPDALALIENVRQDRVMEQKLRLALLDDYGAQSLLVRSGQVIGLAFKTPGPHKGFRVDTDPIGGEYRAYADRRTKIGTAFVGRLIALQRVPTTHAKILGHYGASRLIPHKEGTSPTGFAAAVTTLFVPKDEKRIVLSVPVTQKEPFELPPEGRQIKESEYVAITKEGA